MRKVLLFALIAAAACGPRQVEVRTAPPQATGVSLQVANDLAQATNVYVVVAGTDTFLRQVPAKSTQLVPLPGLSPGSIVTLKAVSIDGTRTVTRANVTLQGNYMFAVP